MAGEPDAPCGGWDSIEAPDLTPPDGGETSSPPPDPDIRAAAVAPVVAAAGFAPCGVPPDLNALRKLPAAAFPPPIIALPASVTLAPAIPPKTPPMSPCPPPATLEATAGATSLTIAGNRTIVLIVSISVMASLSSLAPAVLMIAHPVAMTNAATGLYKRNATSQPIIRKNA